MKKNTLLILLPELFTVAMLTACFTVADIPLSAAPRRPKVKTLEPAPAVSEAFYDKVWRSYQIGSKKEKAEAIKQLKTVLRKSPEEFMAHYYLGIMISEEGSPTTALKHFETALLGFPKSADIHVRMAEILDQRNKVEEAYDHYEKALELEPLNPKALSRMGIFELENGNLSEAHQLLTKAREIQPDNPVTLRALGAILIDRNSPREALPILEQSLMFDEKHAENHWLLAKAYEKLDNPEKATHHFEQARKLGRRDTDIKELIGYDLARSLARSNKMAEAEAEYKKEIRKSQDPTTGLSELAQLYEDIGREDDAIKLYLQAYGMNKKLAAGVMKAAEIYLKRENYEKAEEMLAMLKNDPEFKERARIELEEIDDRKKLQETLKFENTLKDSSLTDQQKEETYYQMLNINKNDPTALEGLMTFYQERGYYDEAISWFRKYNRVNPTSDHNRKLIESDLKNRKKLDDFTLFQHKEPLPFKYVKTPEDDLRNLAFNGDNDRLKEVAFQILLDRKENKSERTLIEGLLNFYAERGRYNEASKQIAAMVRNGYYTKSEGAERRKKLRGR